MSAKIKYRYPDGFPVAALEQHVAIVGKTGSGKTYAAKTLVEPMLSEGRRVCIIDPTGAWYGLRSSADGQAEGFPVVVFGGDHADVPINKGAGKALAEIIGTGQLCAVIDLSEMLIGERHQFMTDFAAALHTANKRPLQLVIDEADEFCPQNPMPETKRMMHQIDRIVRRGRIKGFRVMLITQRPAVLHKNVLTQANMLIAMRLTAPQDRKALMEWVRGQADEKEGKALIDGLPTLKPGQGWVWAPEFETLECVTFPLIRTLDTSKAPSSDDETGPVTLAAVDVASIEAQLSEIVEQTAANDPKVLKARIAQLEREAKARQTPAAAPAPTPQQLHAEFQKGEAAGLANAAKQLDALDPMLMAIDRQFHELMEKMAGLGRAVMINSDHLAEQAANTPTPKSPPPPVAPSPTSRASAGNGADLPKGERANLIAVAQHSDGCTRTQLSILTGYKRSTRDAYIARLAEKGYVQKQGSRIVVTQAGIDALGSDYEPLPTGPALFEWWKDRLPDGERRVLELVAAHWPNALERAAIREATEYARSSCDAYVQRLKARELVTTDSDGVKAADLIF